VNTLIALWAVPVFLWHRIHDDLWPLDRSFVGPNIFANLIWIPIAGLVAYILWPRFRTKLNALLAKALHTHHLLHVQPHHDAVTDELARLGNLVESWLRPAVHPISPPPPTNQPTTKEPYMGTLSELAADIEKRFVHHPPINDLVAEAHTKVRSILETAAKDLLEVAGTVAPQAREVSLGLTKLEEAMMWFNAHIARNQTVAPIPTESTPASPVIDPVQAPAPDPTPVTEPTAWPVADPTPAADPVPAPVDPTPVAPVDPVAPPVPEADAPPAATSPADVAAPPTA
jgi:hypothetical protein